MTAAGYGTWKSPISSQLTTASGVDLMQLRTDSDPNFSDNAYWNEIHADEGGRYVICSSDAAGNIVQWTPKEFNARTTVHEYGGGDFIVYQGVVYFSNFKDQALYKQTSPTATPEPLTDTSKSFRYADGFFSPKKSRIFYVREDHEVVKQGAKEPENTLVAIDPASKKQSVLVKGADFYSCPRVSPDGKKIAWVQWYHPNMPWDSTEVWTAELSASGDEIVPGSAVKVAGGTDASGQDLSVLLPSWTANNELLYIGDQTNWWNLYHVTSSGHVNLRPVEAEIGGPQWQFGRTSYVQEPNGGSRIATSFKSELGMLDTKTGSYQKIDTGFESHDRMGWTSAGSLYMIVSSPTKFPQVIRVDVKTLEVTVICVSMSPPVDSAHFSIPQRISWPTSQGETCHGLLYKPKNKDFIGKPDELPPVLVRAHGGPTGAFFSALDLKIQYFTTRGFAVLCVDYRGSTGYGKLYRNRLRGQWGVLDIDDCRTGVDYLVNKKLADPARTCIDGRSAGGYTTLACLTFTNVFKVGVSHFGVSDLEALMEETHKFESRYLDTLLAPLDKGGREICRERSPIHFLDRINCAVGFFQGDEDKIVPPNQAQMMYDAIKAKGLPAMFVLFQGEQHGFRKAENIQTSLDGEFYFFGRVLGFEPADKEIELPIVNL
ncbi:acylamino-acid-releasing enzyme [Aplysia californica]|uniref:Acylamino-acid-releasing enzyme n=1 Tax=Aplysia californica TaxID=6500 RepID=A0ABM0JUE6_APLCA|nr:acylamino-acid-releasing enzyme [Aplysia californica]XP_005101733.1 acylamino-acid-releasing enzyme [Aplysia californica]XP_005101734.1 acylamino-acid-releasing enzyme [Aplysia californica]